MKDLKNEQTYIDEAAKLKAKGDAFTSVIKKVFKVAAVIVGVLIIAFIAFSVYSNHQQEKYKAAQAEKRAEKSAKLEKAVAGLKAEQFCYVNLGDKECVSMFFIEDTDYHIVIKEKGGYHIYKTDNSGFLVNEDSDFSSSSPFDYATLYPRNISGKPWLEAFDLNGKLFKLENNK